MLRDGREKSQRFDEFLVVRSNAKLVDVRLDFQSRDKRIRRRFDGLKETDEKTHRGQEIERRIVRRVVERPTPIVSRADDENATVGEINVVAKKRQVDFAQVGSIA